MQTKLESLLKSTSRSFYLSLRFAPTALRSGLSLGYLLCRAADTLADTDAVPKTERKKTLKSFRDVMSRFPVPENDFQVFLEQLNSYGAFQKGAEGQLLASLPMIVRELSTHSKTEQSLILEVVSAVLNGMDMDLTLFGESLDSTRALENKQLLENYLRFIGGAPGNFWTKLCLSCYPQLRIKNRTQWIEDGIRYGTGLQMINILRDLPMDLSRGRCYIPSDRLKDHQLTVRDVIENKDPERFLTLYQELIDDTLQRLEYGMTYLLAIPKKSPRLRAPVWWPLAIGLKTLAKLRHTKDILNPSIRVKVKKVEVYKTMVGSVGQLASNWILERSFRKMMEDAS